MPRFGTGKRDVDGAARLAALHGEVDLVDRLRREARQQGIAVIRIAAHAGKARHHVHAGVPGQVFERVVVAAARLDFLQRDDIGAQFFQHRGDPVGPVAAVGTDGAMDVVAGHRHAREPRGPHGAAVQHLAGIRHAELVVGRLRRIYKRR
ncbi:hypothetical protein D3C81_1597690 [compost metagenome]